MDQNYTSIHFNGQRQYERKEKSVLVHSLQVFWPQCWNDLTSHVNVTPISDLQMSGKWISQWIVRLSPNCKKHSQTTNRAKVKLSCTQTVGLRVAVPQAAGNRNGEQLLMLCATPLGSKGLKRSPPSETDGATLPCQPQSTREHAVWAHVSGARARDATKKGHSFAVAACC